MAKQSRAPSAPHDKTEDQLPAVTQARRELTSVREDLTALVALTGEVASCAHYGSTVDHATAVALVARVTGAIGALGTAEACLRDAGAGS